MCCISPEVDENGVGLTPCGYDESCLAGVLYKWTNYRWTSRLFLLRNNGVISYSKVLEPDTLIANGEYVSFIGNVKRPETCRRYKHRKTVGIVHLKVIKTLF